ncbi:unnamed protein product [Spirodela intermedia]|uniref:Uncharacterized protein n=1 Tax=Spirodela intermedia TaxID=51605 RepID=A0A7I8ITT4_SPIIN|nr:unnamed protein product [Spirodela intermedia]CAA6661285.1 unnamed protein product [Spirodela intermedia]
MNIIKNGFWPKIMVLKSFNIWLWQLLHVMILFSL